MSGIRDWLAALDLERFAESFEENEVDVEALAELTDADLKEMGLPLGPRVKLRKAIAALRSGDSQPSQPSPATRATGSTRASEPSLRVSVQSDAERRQLTVLFVDMVGSTRLSGELDPEDMRQLLLDYQSAVSDAVTKYGGHIARYFGDGVLCYFGWPRASEKSAEESVRAGLAVTKAVRELQTPAREALSARVGIATGLVVVGDIIGEGAAEEEAVVGETPNLAARLQSVAQPGQVVVSETTRRLIDAGFSTASLGEVELKGFSRDVGAFVVTGEKSVAAHFEGQKKNARVTTLVGREHELAMIRDRWERAIAGEGQAVLLLGEAGIGKSRIVESFIDELSEHKHYRVHQRWTPFHTDTPFYGSVQHMREIAQFEPGDSDDGKLDKLEKLLFDPTEAPIYAQLLGVDAHERYGELGLTSEELRQKIMDALSDGVIDISKRRPVCMILEDAHWMDASSYELARVTLEKIRNERVLVLMPARPEIDPSFANHPAFTRISLNRLGMHEVREMVGSLAGGKSVPAALVDDIVAKTDGVPLFVEEVTKSVLGSQHVTETEDAYELTVPVDSLEVPATLQDSLMARLDRQPSAKEVAQVAACLGREFETDALQALTGYAEATLTGALDQLREVDVISRRGASAHAYRFRHALLCDAAYQSLLKVRRREIHERIVSFLETAKSNELEVVALHAYRAGMVEKAVDCLRRAASRDFLQSAYAEAYAHATRALRWIADVPSSDELVATEARLQVMQAYALIPKSGYSHAETTRSFERAAEVAGKTGDVSMSVNALTGLALVRMTRGDHDEFASVSARLTQASEKDGRDYIRFYGLMMKGYGHILRCEFAEGRQDIAQAKAFYIDDHERRGLRAGYPMWDCLTWWEQTGALFAGDPAVEEAVCVAMKETLTDQHGRGMPGFARCWTPTFYALHALAFEDYDLVRNVAGRALKLATDADVQSYIAWTSCVLAIVEMAQGDPETATKDFTEADAQIEALEFGWAQPTFRAEWAKALLSRGRVAEAEEQCQQALRALDRTQQLWWEAEVGRLQGDIRLAQGDAQGAEIAYRQALSVAQRQGARFWEPRIQRSLDSLLGGEGRVGG